MNGLVLGVDSGGTKTIAALVAPADLPARQLPGEQIALGKGINSKTPFHLTKLVMLQ